MAERRQRPADAGAGSGVLSRAWSAPVRAVSRMWNSTDPHPSVTDGADDVRSGVVDCALYVDGVRRPEPVHYAEALEKARQHRNAFVWLGLHEPSAAEMGTVAKAYGLHELAAEDAVKGAQRPKLEQFSDEVTFMVLRTARYVDHDVLTETSEVVETGHVMAFVAPKFVITVRHGDACRLAPVRAGLEEKPELLEQGPWAVAYAVTDRVVDLYIEVAEKMEMDFDAIEESVFSREGHGRIQHIYQLKRELVEFRRAVIPLQRPLMALTADSNAEVPKVIRRYFRDVQDHLTRTVEQINSYDELLNSILQARLAQVTVDQNNDMRKIAAWAAIAAVQTAIAGIYGMNFRFMPELEWRYGYPAVLLLMLCSAVVLYRFFRRSGWL